MEKKYRPSSEASLVVNVEASAGSGKTYTLAKRYIYLLLKPQHELDLIPLRYILAITFTNKATVEMKERILEFLKKIALDVFSSDQEEKEILFGMEKKYAKNRAEFVMDQIIGHYNFFQVQTIDSFINSLLLGSALSINRSSSFQIKRDYYNQMDYCLDLVIDEAVTDKKVYNLLEEFLSHYLFVENREGWFPKEDINSLMKSFFSLSNKYGKEFEAIEGKTSDIIMMKKDIFNKIVELSNNFPEGINKTAQNSIIKFIENNQSIFEISSLPVKFQQSFVPMNKNKDCEEAFETFWLNVHNEIKDLIEIDAIMAYSPYIKLFKRLINCFQYVSKAEDIVFLEELNRKANSLFDEVGIGVAEIYYRLSTRFKHYLIDEFQDTSLLQWNNLRLMVEDALSCGGSLFYVGDRKQAIYRFRGGDVRLFDDIKRYFEHFKVKSVYLKNNWRSHKEIVEFNNNIFSRENLIRFLDESEIRSELDSDSHGVDQILSTFTDAKQEFNSENDCGYVYIETINEKNQEERNAIIKPKILELIKELIDRFRYTDITILARNNYEVELITSWLIEADYPVESEKTLNVLNNHLIKEIISFMKFLNSPIDDLSFGSFILGKIFSFATGITQVEIRDFIFNLRKEHKIGGDISLYRLFRQKYEDIWNEYFDIYFKNVGILSNYEMLISIYSVFRISKNFMENQAFFMKFLELLKIKEDEYIGLRGFLDYLKEPSFDDLYVNVAKSDCIKIFTIHKAKGLEFPVVIVPFLRMNINTVTGGNGTSSYVVHGEEQKLNLFRITQKHRQYSLELEKIYIENYKQACIDELNNIYVALTRAKFELYIFIPKKSGASNNKAFYIVPQDLNERGNKKVYEIKNKKEMQSIIKLDFSKYKNWIETVKTEFGDLSQIKNYDKILEGNLYHAILAKIGNCNNENIEKLMEQVLNQISIYYPTVENIAYYLKNVKRMLNNKILREFFYIQDGYVQCEKEFVNFYGDSKRIDRIIIKDKEIIIIDYKISKENENEHKEQIREYMAIVENIYLKKYVKGFILYLDDFTFLEVLNSE